METSTIVLISLCSIAGLILLILIIISLHKTNKAHRILSENRNVSQVLKTDELGGTVHITYIDEQLVKDAFVDTKTNEIYERQK